LQKTNTANSGEKDSAHQIINAGKKNVKQNRT